MDSKKLGMFAAAALTVIASQANAGDAAKKDAKATAKADQWVCASSCSGTGKCAGQTHDAAKDKAACDTAKGKWVTAAEFEKAKNTEHKHKH